MSGLMRFQIYMLLPRNCGRNSKILLFVFPFLSHSLSSPSLLFPPASLSFVFHSFSAIFVFPSCNHISLLLLLSLTSFPLSKQSLSLSFHCLFYFPLLSCFLYPSLLLFPFPFHLRRCRRGEGGKGREFVSHFFQYSRLWVYVISLTSNEQAGLVMETGLLCAGSKSQLGQQGISFLDKLIKNYKVNPLPHPIPLISQITKSPSPSSFPLPSPPSIPLPPST